MADDIDKKNDSDDRIATLLGKYKEENKNIRFPDARNTYYDIITEIESSTLDIIDNLVYKTKLLQNTNANILKCDVYVGNKTETLFLEEVKKFKNYLEYYWYKIDHESFKAVSKLQKNIIEHVATNTIKVVEEVLHFQDIAKRENPPPINKDGEKNETYQKHINNIVSVMEEGMNALSPILPLFSIWGMRGEEINKEVKENRGFVEEKAKEVNDAVENVKEIGTKKAYHEASKKFKATAGTHEIKQKTFLCYAQWSAVAAVVWGIICIAIVVILLSHEKESSIVYLLPSGLLISGVVIGCMYASLRAYFANAHSEAVNLQRFNAIQSYLESYKTLSDTHGDLFARKATEAAFEHVPTGFTKYHKEDSKSSDSSEHLALIATSLAVKEAIKTKGGGGSGTGH